MLLKLSLFIALLLLQSFYLNAQSTPLSNQQLKAITYLDSFSNLQQSSYWINIKPKMFIQNIKINITKPKVIYAGSNTNFCAFAAISYTCINTYPLLYVHFMLELYINGRASFRETNFHPSDNVMIAAGLLKFKGKLDINPADQMWFMSLADHFKGYINLLNLRYKPGSEDYFWPSTNFRKFNRMLRRICNYETHAVGTDLIRPYFKDITSYLNHKLANNHQVFLFLNNAILHKWKYNKVKFRFPTHYVVLLSITEKDGMITMSYWDYGFCTQREMPLSVFKDIVFGVTWCKKQNEK
jgi:hypothetical protein